MLRSLTLLSLVLAAIGVALFLFPPDSDGAFASFDGMLLGVEAEHQGVGAIRGQHPLCHVIILGLMPALRALGVAAPAHVAARILSGLSAAAVLVILVRAAGTRRWYVGAGFALLIFAMREFIIDAAVGETVLPGCAAALWALDQATRNPIHLGRVWTGLVIALLVREDNVLIVPGVAAALWIGMDPIDRFGKIARGLAACAAVTAAGYAACWWLATRGQVSFWNYLVQPALGPTWTGSLRSFPVYLDALGAGVVGRTWPISDPNVWLGPGVVVAMLGAAWLLSGRVRAGPVSLAIVVTLIVRAAFFTWWSVESPKWAALTMGLAAFLGARLAEGEPRFRLRARIAGAIVLVLLIAAPLAVHAALTWHLRERRFMGAINQAVREGPGCRFIAHGPGVGLAFEFLDIPYTQVRDVPDARASLDEALRLVHGNPGPTMVVMDRLMLCNDPYATAHARKERMFLDGLPSTPELTVLRWEGLAYAIRYDPNAPR